MNPNVNTLLGLITGIIAVCIFTLEIGGNPNESRWLTLPRHLRLSFHITAWFFMVRSVDFFTLSRITTPTVGQGDWIALGAGASMMTSVLLGTIYAARLKLPAKAWDRIGWAFHWMKHHPGDVPVMMPAGDILDAHHASGYPAADGEKPQSVISESVRAGHMASRP